ncbi:MAG: response regulator [Defluviitaleaceae bacterium]|nr:response regulator [Defluviitaleaceae bacterium]
MTTLDISVIIENKESLANFEGLNGEHILALIDQPLQDYAEYLEAAINLFPIQKAKLELSFGAKDYLQAMKWVSAIRNNLVKIFADQRASEWTKCFENFNDRENLHHERVGATIEYLLADATLFFTGLQSMLEQQEANHLATIAREETFARHKQQILAVCSLNAAKVMPIEDEQLGDYFTLLNDFVDGLVHQENGIKTALSTNNYDGVLELVAQIAQTLSQIHADDLAGECTQHVQAQQGQDPPQADKIELFANYLLKNLDILADDIIAIKLPQKAAPKDEQSGTTSAIEGIIEFNDCDCAKSILLVNDIRIFLENFRVALSNTGYNLVGATMGDAALEYMRNNKPSLLIVDDQIPNLDAIDFVKKVRGRGYNMPTILLTSDITQDYMAKAMSVGVVDFLIKPVITAKVLEKIAKHLS